MYEICLELLGASDEQRNRFKLSQICGEAVDEYIRKMRTTGIISLRGNGRFIDYNAWEIEKIDYILEHYSEYKTFKSKDEYFEYIGAVDTTVVSMQSAVPTDTTDLRKNALKSLRQSIQKRKYILNCKRYVKSSKHRLYAKTIVGTSSFRVFD